MPPPQRIAILGLILFLRGDQLHASACFRYYISLLEYWEMPKHAAAMECDPESRQKLMSMSRSRTQETRMVERARIVLACLEGKEIQ